MSRPSPLGGRDRGRPFHADPSLHHALQSRREGVDSGVRQAEGREARGQGRPNLLPPPPREFQAGRGVGWTRHVPDPPPSTWRPKFCQGLPPISQILIMILARCSLRWDAYRLPAPLLCP